MEINADLPMTLSMLAEKATGVKYFKVVKLETWKQPLFVGVEHY